MNIQELYSLVGCSRDYQIGDIVVAEMEVGEFWIGQIWKQNIDPDYLSVLWGIYSNRQAKSCVSKRYVRPATDLEAANYRDLRGVAN